MFGSLISAYVTRVPRHRGKIRAVGALVRLTGSRSLTTAYGCKLQPDWRDETNMMSILGYYPDVFKAVSQIRPGMAFLDIGANAGIFSFIAAERVGASGCVVAFEPSLPIFTKLVGNAVLNRATTFFPFNAAIGESTKVSRFASAGENHTGLGYLSEDGSSSVLQLGGDELLDLLRPLVGEREMMIKIDVEGAEAIVARALAPLLQSSPVRTAIVEIDPVHLRRFGDSAEDIYRVFEAAGFKASLGRGFKAHYNEVFER